LGRSYGLTAVWYETAVFDGGGYFGQNLDSETDVSASIVFSSPFIFSKKMKLHFFTFLVKNADFFRIPGYACISY
jgi:hypothetical protein